MTNNCHSAASKPTETYSEFLSQRSAAAAQQYLIEYFEANHRSRNVCINQGMTSALWSGVIGAHKIGSPKNLSPFFVPRRSASGGTSSTPNLICQHLKQIEGQGLDSTEIKLATKQKISISNDFHDFHHQLCNFLLLLKFIFGENSILFLRVEAIVNHVSSYESEYEERQGASMDFYAEFLSLFDRRVQTFLEFCSNTTDVAKIDFSILSFDSILRGVLDGTFKADLPSSIRTVLLNLHKSKEKEIDKNGNNNILNNYNPKRPGPNNPTTPPNKRQRGNPDINAEIYPAWKLKPNEDYVDVFIKNIDRSKLPKMDMCLNYHVRGTCHSNCPRASTHVAASTLDEATKKSVTEYIAKVRSQQK